MRTLIGFCCLVGTIVSLSFLHAQEAAPEVPGLIASLDGHTETVYTAGMTPDGSIVATGSFDKSIKLWDAKTGKELRTYAGQKGHQKLVLSLAFSPKGDLLASGGSDNQAKIWDVPIRSPLRDWAQNAEVAALALSPDGKRLATACKDGSVKIWSTEDNKQLFNLTGHTGESTGVWFSGNNQIVASSGVDGTIRFWNAMNGQSMGVIVAHDSTTGVTIHPNNSQAYSIGEDGLLKYWRVPPQPVRNLQAHGEGVTTLSLSNDGNHLLTGTADKMVRWSNFGNGQRTRDFTGAPGAIASVAMAPNNSQIAAGVQDGTLMIWQNNGQLQSQVKAHDGALTGVTFNGSSNQVVTVGDDGLLKQWMLPIQPERQLDHPAAITAGQLRQDGNRLITAGSDKVLRLWRLDNNTVEREFRGLASPPTAVSLAPNGQFVLSASEDGLIRLWNAGNGQAITDYFGHTARITSVHYSPRNDRFVSTDEDGFVKVWQLPPQEPRVMTNPAPIRKVVMAPDGNRILVLGDDKQARLWNLTNGNNERNYSAGGQNLTAIAYAANNSTVAFASVDKVIHIWNGGNEARKIPDLPGAVQSIAFSPDTQRVAVGLSDNTIRVYQINDGKEIQKIEGHTSPAIALAYTPNNQLLISGSKDKTVRLWNVGDGTPKGQLAQPEAVIDLGLSPDGSRLVVGTSDKTIGVYTLADQKQVTKFSSPAEITGVAVSNDGKLIAVSCADNKARAFGEDGKVREIIAHDAATTGVAIHPDGKRIITVSTDKTARLQTLALVGQIALASTARQARFTPQGDRIFVVGDDKALRILDAGNATEQKSIPAHDAAVLGLSINNDASKVVTIGADKKAKVWTIGDGKAIATIDLPGTPESVAITPDAARIAVALVEGESRHLRAYDVGTGTPLQDVAQPASAIHALDFAPDGRQLWFAGDDKAAMMRDVAAVKALTVHPGGAVDVALHSNNVHVFTAGKDKAVKQWDLNQLKEIRAFGPLPDEATCLALSRDFQQIAAASGKTLKIWNVGDGKEVVSLEHPASVTSAWFNGNRQRIATGATDNLARVWEIASGKELEAFSYGAEVTGVAYHPSQDFVAAASADKTGNIHPLNILRLVVASPQPLRAITMNSNGAYVLTGGDEKVVKAFNTGNGNPDRTFEGANEAITAVAITNNTQVVAIGCADKTIRLHRFDNAQLIASITAPGIPTSLAFHPQKPILTGSCDNNAVVAWNTAYNLGQPVPAEFGKPIQEFQHRAVATGVTFNNDGSLFFSGSLDQSAKEWKIASDEPIKNMGHPNLVDVVTFSPDGKQLATGCHDGRVRIFDVEKGNQIRQIDAHVKPQASPVYCVAFSPDGTKLVSGSFDKTLKLWDANNGNMIREFKAYDAKDFDKGHRSGVFCVAFSPDGRFIVSGSSDRSLKMWDVNNGNVVREFTNPNYKPGPLPGAPEAHPGWIYQVRFIDKGTHLISVGSAPKYHGYLALWNVADGKMLAGHELPTGSIHGLGVSQDGSILALGCGPKDRAAPDSSGLIVKTPGK